MSMRAGRPCKAEQKRGREECEATRHEQAAKITAALTVGL
jgi:hypothetical protein